MWQKYFLLCQSYLPSVSNKMNISLTCCCVVCGSSFNSSSCWYSIQTHIPGIKVSFSSKTLTCLNKVAEYYSSLAWIISYLMCWNSWRRRLRNNVKTSLHFLYVYYTPSSLSACSSFWVSVFSPFRF